MIHCSAHIDPWLAYKNPKILLEKKRHLTHHAPRTLDLLNLEQDLVIYTTCTLFFCQEKSFCIEGNVSTEK